MMRILQVCPGYFPAIGGVEEHVKNIAERLALDYEVTVFTADPSRKLPKEEMVNRVLIKRFRSFSPDNSYHFSFEMAKELKNSEFNIVHGHNYHAFPLFFSQYAKRTNFIVTPHYHGQGHSSLSNFFLKLYKPFGSQLFQKADSIITVSEYEKELLVRDFPLNESRIQIIPNGIDKSEFKDLSQIAKEPRTILSVGRLEEYKGFQHIIASLTMLDKDYLLKIVGKGPYKANLVTQVNKLGLTDRVTFYQDLSRVELLQMYARASVFVLLSKLEAFSIVVAEALAAKTPCIVANTTALSEWVDNKNCFGVDYPINTGGLAKLINQVAGTQIKDVKIWDWDAVVERLERIYNK